MEDFNVAPVTNRRGGNWSWFCIVCVSIDWRGDPEGLGVSTSMDKGNPRPIVQTISRWQSENRGGSWCWSKSCGTIIQTHLKTETEQPGELFWKDFLPSTVCPAWGGWPGGDLGRPRAQRAERKGFATLIKIRSIYQQKWAHLTMVSSVPAQVLPTLVSPQWQGNRSPTN